MPFEWGYYLNHNIHNLFLRTLLLCKDLSAQFFAVRRQLNSPTHRHNFHSTQPSTRLSPDTALSPIAHRTPQSFTATSQRPETPYPPSTFTTSPSLVVHCDGSSPSLANSLCKLSSFCRPPQCQAEMPQGLPSPKKKSKTP